VLADGGRNAHLLPVILVSASFFVVVGSSWSAPLASLGDGNGLLTVVIVGLVGGALAMVARRFADLQ
jgi:hypothetical protein